MHPAANYIKYLIAKGWPDGEDAETINLMLRTFDLPQIETMAFEQILLGMKPPKNFMFGNKRDRTTVKFMRDEGIYTLWQPKADERAALDIIILPQVKETIQILLVGRLSPEEIAVRIEKKFGKKIAPRTIEVYRHYFWNVERVSTQEWCTLLYSHAIADHYLAALWGSKNQALYRAGFSPMIDGRKALREAHRSLFMRLEATRFRPDNKDTARMVATLSKELVTVHNALYGEGAGVEEAMKELRTFKMERADQSNVVSIDKLVKTGSISGAGKKEGTSDGES